LPELIEDRADVRSANDVPVRSGKTKHMVVEIGKPDSAPARTQAEAATKIMHNAVVLARHPVDWQRNLVRPVAINPSGGQFALPSRHVALAPDYQLDSRERKENN
jgi:hypothetical protein